MEDNKKNTGSWNTCYMNTGYMNTGSWNTGSWNTGDRNTGDHNTGSWNKCNNESGYFNSTTSELIRVFNKIVDKKTWDKFEKPNFIYFGLTEWINSEDMSSEEKELNPSHIITDGFLKICEYKEAFKRSWDEAPYEDKIKILDCPNFDNDVFFEISGINVEKELNKQKKVSIELTQEQLDKIKHLL